MAVPECIWDLGCALGEGPFWAAATRELYFVDIEAPAIHRYGDGRRETFPVEEKIGSLVPTMAGGFVAGLKSGFHRIELPAQPGPAVATRILDPEPERPGNRFNDGKCDAEGRFYAGTMDDAIVAPTGVLYRLDPDLSCHALDDGYVVTNGPAFSPDGSTFYHNASSEGVVYVFDRDPATGAIANKRVFVRLEGDAGVPDGLTTDRDGHVWLAHWGGSRVTRFDPDGKVVTVLPLPVSQVTSCCFGGAELDVLYITSARTGLTPAQLADEPLAGGLFAVTVDARGMLPHAFGG